MPEFGPDDLAVIIPSRDRWPILRRTLDALREQTTPGFEVIVVVDGTDQAPPELDGVRVVVKDHGGPGAARNAGVHETNRQIVLFLGDDMIPEPSLVARHVHAHTRHTEAEAAVLGHVDVHRDVTSNRLNRWMDWSGTQFDYRNIAGEEAGFGRFYSCNVSLKRDFFIGAGGFDEDFVYYYEDLDCGYRLHEHGMRLFYEPKAVVHHLHALRWSDVVRRFQGVARGERLMAAKHPWFEPFFAARVRRALRQPPRSKLWTAIVERIPPTIVPLRAVAEQRADAYYNQQVGPYFLDAWEAERDLEELREYLGDAFDISRLSGHMCEVRRELESVGDEQTFYRSSEAYLYDLTAFAMSATKVPYLQALRMLVPRHAKLLDWGCGIGSDGLRLLTEGYRVSFADFDNPSTRYLRWRLRRRGLEAEVFDLDRDVVPGGFDAAYAFDVIEHVEDAFAFLAELEDRAAVVIVNLLEDEPDALHPHRSLPIAAILDHARSRGLLTYALHHGRSHLVAYRGSGPRPRRSAGLRSSVRRRLRPRQRAGRVPSR